jgi:hypothetical protein
VEPDFTRDGCSIPVTLTFQELTGKNVLLLPIGNTLYIQFKNEIEFIIILIVLNKQKIGASGIYHF